MTELSATYQRFLHLLQCGIYTSGNRTVTLGARLSDRQWYKIMEEAEKQTVSGVVFSAVSRLPEEEMPSLPVVAQWLAMTHREMLANGSMSGVLDTLVATFRRNGLHPVLQKGHATARFYPDPRLRSFGDIDLWFPGKERAEADRIIAGMGIKVASTPDYGSRYRISATDVEHHSLLIEVHDPTRSRMLARLYAGNPPVEVTLADGNRVEVPAPMVELLMINVHILKHCLGVGIGLRQFCDYSLAWRSMTVPDAYGNVAVDSGEYLEICRRLGIERWTSVLHQFIDHYLPSPEGSPIGSAPDAKSAEAVERIFSLVAEGGNFGHYSRRRYRKSRSNILTRKVSTMLSFIHNRSFVYRLVPSEAFWTFTRLLLGQIH